MSDKPPFRNEIPFIKDLGIEFLSMTPGESRLALQLQARHLNSWNVAHGGVIMTLLDVAMAVAGRSLQPNAQGGVTVEMKTSFLQPAKGGSRITAIGRTLHRSTTLAFCEAEIRGPDNALVAKSMGTFKYLRHVPAADDGLQEAPNA